MGINRCSMGSSQAGLSLLFSCEIFEALRLMAERGQIVCK